MKNKIINIVVLSLCAIALIVGIYLYINLQNKKEELYKEEIYDYLTQDINSIKGLMNYDFEQINSNISTEVLKNSYFLESSLLNDEGINNIYVSLYNVSKDKFISASNYVANPYQNCYYYENTLKKTNYNCSSVCSKSTSEIMNEIKNKFGWDNILPEDAKTYCIQNAVYLLEGSGYFVNLSDIKNLYKELTNKDIEYDNIIKNNKYYKYGAYLAEDISSLNTFIKSIDSVDEIKKKNNLYITSYTVTLNDNTTKNGIITLEKNEDNYYIVANSIGMGYNLN